MRQTILISSWSPVAWYRRAPVACALLTSAASAGLLRHVASSAVGLGVLVVSPYAVGRFASRRRSAVGLAVCIAGPWVSHALGHAPATDWVFTAGVSAAAWATGYVLQGRSRHAHLLESEAWTIASEDASRVRLAVAGERSRVRGELQGVVVRGVSTMILEARAAEGLLLIDAARADEALAALETLGRRTASDMRRLLGVLRGESAAELLPQPGLAEIPTLLHHARAQDRQVTLRVEGDPGPLAQSSELAVYRVIEESLSSVGAANVTLRFTPTELVVEIVSSDLKAAPWPTEQMRERIALCRGGTATWSKSDDGTLLGLRIPITPDKMPV